MTHLEMTPSGPKLTIVLPPGLLYHGITTSQHGPLFDLSLAIDGFMDHFKRSPTVCITGPDEAETLESSREAWQTWGITLLVRDYASGTFMCGREDVEKS